MVTVRYFAAAAEAARCGAEQVPLAAGGTLGDLRSALADRHGAAMERVLRVAAFLQNDELTRDLDAPAAARVDVLPPFAGG
ncbi:MoaD/ThiS family protein [Rhodococcus sp. NPDC058505]|uniref:MoaD/ThiS family protein n=1 Tax=unclassified Rhodococcus (in: high G+C Gram-positive bacteria) TaxID=192944 RepID=UPI003668E372